MTPEEHNSQLSIAGIRTHAKKTSESNLALLQKNMPILEISPYRPIFNSKIAKAQRSSREV